MASQDITALFFDQEEIPMALLFGPETVVPGRRCAISSMGATFDRVQVLEALKAMFPSHLQVIVWKNAENLPVSLESMTFEEMEQAVAFKARGEACTIVGDSQLEYNNLKAQYSSAINESERIGVLVLMKNLLFDAIFTNLAANALKSYGTFTNTSTGLAYWIIGNCLLWTKLEFRPSKIESIETWPVLHCLGSKKNLSLVLEKLRKGNLVLTVANLLKLHLKPPISLTELPLVK